MELSNYILHYITPRKKAWASYVMRPYIHFQKFIIFNTCLIAIPSLITGMFHNTVWFITITELLSHQHMATWVVNITQYIQLCNKQNYYSERTIIIPCIKFYNEIEITTSSTIIIAFPICNKLLSYLPPFSVKRKWKPQSSERKV